MDDLKLKMEKDVGVWITYVNEVRDVVIPVEGHFGYVHWKHCIVTGLSVRGRRGVHVRV